MEYLDFHFKLLIWHFYVIRMSNKLAYKCTYIFVKDILYAFCQCRECSETSQI